MPIQVYIEVNGRPIETLHIGRIEGSANPESLNTYSAVVRTSDTRRLPGGRQYTIDYPSNNEWDNGFIFQHKYEDGIEACIAKALEGVAKPHDPNSRRN